MSVSESLLRRRFVRELNAAAAAPVASMARLRATVEAVGYAARLLARGGQDVDGERLAVVLELVWLEAHLCAGRPIATSRRGEPAVLRAVRDVVSGGDAGG